MGQYPTRFHFKSSDKYEFMSKMNHLHSGVDVLKVFARTITTNSAAGSIILGHVHCRW